ncbi:hypothetical protein GCM10027160_17460 [Streptomyces calidiresistens]|uniref:Uncharacterized protein n=1 Tax=Streptomyces calidiresistens TaxID=1485586 RepID=A0A7W3T2V9_9ACTN|nr:hypothetical protein [Streptomyces calidiresistens]MBB0229949.1 hypothetical protein [Streptomyces calidiresistens]
MPTATRAGMPWHVQLVEYPPPLTGGRADIVQTGSRLGMCTLDDMRKLGLPVGPVLYCATHLLLHIPVEAGTAHRWHVPQTLCRPGSTSCVVTGPETGGGRCHRIWMTPHDSTHGRTSASDLRHRLLVMRSALATGRAA